MKINSKLGSAAGAAIVLSLSVGCSSMKQPATTDVAVSKSVVDSAGAAGGAEFAPVEMSSARSKMALANQAMAAKDYKLALDLANQAQADAKLAQAKVNSGKAQMVANTLQEDLRVMREELERARLLAN